MKTFKEFKVMDLRPAYYNGEVFEIDVEFNEASVFSVGIEIVKVLKMAVGDTVRIGGKVCDGSDSEYINIYMCGDALSDFIDRFGVGKLTRKIRMKLELTFAVYNCNDYGIEPKEEEITAYKLIEIIEE